MPAQALIRKLTRDEVTAWLAANDAKDILSVEEAHGCLLVKTTPGADGYTVPAHHAKLQALADADAKAMNLKYKDA